MAVLVPVVLVAILLSHLIDDVLAGAAVIVLWLIWVLLHKQHQLPVLPMAMSFQWTQVTCGLFYCGLTGRELEAVYASEYRPMVAIGLVCVVMITIGLAAGLRLVSGREPREGPEPRYVLSWRALMVVYIGATFLSSGLRSTGGIGCCPDEPARYASGSRACARLPTLGLWFWCRRFLAACFPGR